MGDAVEPLQVNAAGSNVSRVLTLGECYSQYLQGYAGEPDQIGQSQFLGSIDQTIALANTCFNLGYYPQALELYKHALAGVQAEGNGTPTLDNPILQASLIGRLGNIALVTGNYQQALDHYQQQHALVSASGEPEMKVIATANLGNAYLRLRQYDTAVKLHQEALANAQSLEIPALEAQILGSLGVTSLLSSDFSEAIAYQQQALNRFKSINDTSGEASTLVNLGLIDAAQGRFSQAIEQYQQGLTLIHALQDRSMEAATLGNLGNAYHALGNYDQAKTSLQQQLDVAKALGDRQQEANALGNLGNVHNSLDQHDQAIALMERQLFIVQDIGDRAGEAHALNNLGESYREQDLLPQATDVYQQALTLFQEIGNQQAAAIVIGNLGLVQAAQNQHPEALAYHQQALALKQQVGDRDGERVTLSEMGDLFVAQGQEELAIIFYKQSVNVSEAIRKDLQALPRELQQSYADEIVADTYRALADLLLKQDRVLEAQRVLDLLKVQELEDYLGQVRGNEKTEPGLDFHPAEQQILDLYDQAIALGLELEQLRAIPSSDRTPSQEARLHELVNLEQDLTTSFFDFVDSPEIVELVNQLSRTARRQNLNLDQLNALRDDLKRLDQNAVLFYPLILDDRLELILVTPYSPPIRRTVPVSRDLFNRTVLNFRQELVKPYGETFASAQQLYNWLIAPLESDLAAANAETIVYAPDGQLRYIPLNALRNGEQWLVEQYRVNNITAASLTNFDIPPAQNPQVLAAAFKNSDQRYSFDIAQRSFTLAGLPFAGVEVDAIAAEIPNTTVLLDPDFTRAQTVPQMNDHTIVHLATHAEFVTGTPDESFILFGDGDRATLRDVATWSLSNVDLVVLSACKTAVGGALGNGEEILGFGYQIQRTGARAAIASLWSVDDGGTQVLMNLFYEALNNSNLSKAEALQQAQVAMLAGDFSALGLDPSAFNQPISVYQHPRYWSPFILIGNGL